MEEIINKFLLDKKADRIKKKSKSYMSEAERAKVKLDAEQECSFKNWVPNAAKRAPQLSSVTHVGKVTHPDARISPIIAHIKRSADGWLHTGNINVEPDQRYDVLCNAGALDIYKFLVLRPQDGLTILEHLENNTQEIKQILSIPSITFEALRAQFLAIKKNPTSFITSDKVKQVYFPVSEQYHLLSILTPSPIMFELKKRINKIRFSEETKQAKEAKRKNLYHEHGFDDLYNLTKIGYGGAKPQNISVLNYQNGGSSYLLPCIPPKFSQPSSIRLPKKNFFNDSLPLKYFKLDFVGVIKILFNPNRNINVRDQRDKDVIQPIIEKMIAIMWSIRQQPPGWSDRCDALPISQKKWLDEAYKQQREEDLDWLDEIISASSRWFVTTFKRFTQFSKIEHQLGDVEMAYFRKMMRKNKENLL